MSPIVSVIIPTKDRPHVVGQALESIAAQQFTDVEAIVVNDGGQDVRPVLTSLPERFEVRLVDLPESLGPSGARNAGIETAAGRYVGFLDDEDLYLPGHLANAVEILESGRADFVYAAAPIVTERGVVGAEDLSSVSAEAYDVPFNGEFLEVLNYIPPSSVVCRRPPVGARFDTTLRVEEDWDMWLRLVREHGFRIAHEPRPGVLYHRVSDVDSITSAVDSIPINKLFADNYHRITERWQVPEESRAAAYRRWMHHAYDTLFAQLRENRPPGINWFERLMRVLLAGFLGEIDDETVEKGIRAAIIAGEC